MQFKKILFALVAFTSYVLVLTLKCLMQAQSPTCDCAGSPFIDKDHGYTKGDVGIIRSKKLRKLICKVPQYREGNC